MSVISEKAKELHQKMIDEPVGSLFKQEELQVLIGSNAVDLLILAQELINNKLIKLIKQGDELKFQAVNESEATKISSMSNDEAMIYSYIEASGREGIWTKTIKMKTNLHQHVVIRCLKSLENQRYVKAIKSVKHPTRKIYMLYNLQPSVDVTGGPWFTDNELDTEFIDSLLSVIWRYVATQTYPSYFNPELSNNPLQSSYPASYSNYPTLDKIMEFIVNNKITNIDLNVSDVRSLCEVLVHDDRLELVKNQFDCYKVTWQSMCEGNFVPNNNDDFSIFDTHDAIQNDTDLVYIDSWID